LGSCGEVLGGLVAPLPPADVMNHILGYQNVDDSTRCFIAFVVAPLS